MAALDTFTALRDYVKGKIDQYELESADDSIFEVKENRQNRGQSEIIVEFDNEEEFFSSIGISEDDSWFYKVVNAPYSDYELYDWYTSKEDFENGWGLYNTLDNENIYKLSKISKFIVPSKVNFEDEEYKIKLSDSLLKNFKKETEEIIDNYRYERNSEMRDSSINAINKELKDYLDYFGITPYNDGFKISVGELVGLYIKENAIHLPIDELLKKMSENSTISVPGGWFEKTHEYSSDENFDEESFNDQVSKELDKILEKLEDSQEGVSTKDYIDMVNRVTNKFEQDIYYILPKDKTKKTRFRVDGFEFPNMKIVVTLQNGLKRRTIKLSEDNFYHLLYQPTLFNLEEV